MENKFIVTDVESWLNLPNIKIPLVNSEKDTGSIFDVKKTGFRISEELSQFALKEAGESDNQAKLN